MLPPRVLIHRVIRVVPLSLWNRSDVILLLEVHHSPSQEAEAAHKGGRFAFCPVKGGHTQGSC